MNVAVFNELYMGSGAPVLYVPWTNLAGMAMVRQDVVAS